MPMYPLGHSKMASASRATPWWQAGEEKTGALAVLLLTGIFLVGGLGSAGVASGLAEFDHGSPPARTGPTVPVAAAPFVPSSSGYCDTLSEGQGSVPDCYWWSGEYYHGSTSQTALLKTTIQVPNHAPDPANFYYDLLSAWDTATTPSYDQFGFADNYGTWLTFYSYTTCGSSGLIYHQTQETALTSGSTYTFEMQASGGTIVFQLSGASSGIWSQSTGADAFHEAIYSTSFSCGGTTVSLSPFTVYEEAHSGYLGDSSRVPYPPYTASFTQISDAKGLVSSEWYPLQSGTSPAGVATILSTGSGWVTVQNPATSGVAITSLSASPTSVLTGQPVTFTAAMTYGSGSEWTSFTTGPYTGSFSAGSCGGGTETPNFGSGTSATATETWSCTFSSAGTYTVGLTTTDQVGTQNGAPNTVTITVKAPTYYTVTFVVDPTNSGCTFVFNGNIYPNGASVQVQAGTYDVSHYAGCTGYTFSTWAGSGGVGDVSCYLFACTVPVTGDGTFTVTFTPNPETVTFATSPTSCQLTFNGLWYGNGGTATVTSGAYSISARACSGEIFKNWGSTAGTVQSSTSSSTSIMVDATGTLTATYVAPPPGNVAFTIAPSSCAFENKWGQATYCTITFNGNVYRSGQSVSAQLGKSYSLQANPVGSWFFSSWSSTAGSIASPKSASTTIFVSSAGTITANFVYERIPPPLPAGKFTGGPTIVSHGVDHLSAAASRLGPAIVANCRDAPHLPQVARIR